MDKKKILMPILGMIGALLLALIITFPMLSMEIKDIPIGILSLDEGVNTPNGEINAGKQVIKQLTKVDNPAINFEKAGTEKELKQNLKDGKYYAAILIPKDFTAKSASKQAKLEVTINEGINPMVTTNLQTMLSAMSEKSGVSMEINSINKVPTELGIKAMLLPMMFILLTFITSLVTSLLITFNLKTKNKTKSYLLELLYIIIAAFVIGFAVSGIIMSVIGIDLGLTNMALYLTVVSLGIMLLANGSVNLLGKKGLIIPILLFVFGMGLIQLPYEFLNSIWQVLVASWEPFRYIGIGIREILFQNAGLWNSSTISIIIIGIIGILLSVINILKKEKKVQK